MGEDVHQTKRGEMVRPTITRTVSVGLRPVAGTHYPSGYWGRVPRPVGRSERTLPTRRHAHSRPSNGPRRVHLWYHKGTGEAEPTRNVIARSSIRSATSRLG